MSPYPNATVARPGGWSWPARAEAWLDARGRTAWIIAMVAGFIIFWPVGLALLAYALWRGKMSGTCAHKRHGHHDRSARWGGRDWGGPVYMSSGNGAFDAYKDATLKRLEEEQEAFAAFMQRLRDAKDKQEFDSFMADRAEAARKAPVADTPAEASATRNGDY